MIAAKRVFSTKGFSKSTMEDIAKEAELSPGTLYLYFKNKDELFSSLSIRILQYLNIRLEHVVNNRENLSMERKIDALQEAMHDVYKFDPLMLINMFHLQSGETIKNLSQELIDDIKTLSVSSLATMSRLFEDEINRGEFIDSSPIVLADVVWSMFSGIVLWEESKKIIRSGSSQLEQTLDLAFEIFRRGVRNNLFQQNQKERGDKQAKA